MGFDQKKKGEISLTLLLMMILLETNTCRAALIVKRNSTYQRNGRLDDYRIAEDLELELDLLVGSNFIRILGDHDNQQVSKGSQNRGKQAIPCPKNQPYDKCLPPDGGNPDCRGIYNKSCPKR